jgi:hypothetical protein
MVDTALEAKTDRELLLLTVQELGHIKGHLEKLDKKVGLQNGRLSALEKWRWWLVGAGAVVVPLSPLLVYEVRQGIFGGFGG